MTFDMVMMLMGWPYASFDCFLFYKGPIQIALLLSLGTVQKRTFFPQIFNYLHLNQYCLDPAKHHID